MGTTDIKEIRLPNGLQVVLVKDPSASLVSVQTYVRAGSIDEGALLGSGLSHYLEHLLAGGTTKKRTEDQYKELLATLGGAYNAYTTLDHTSYYINTTPPYTTTAISILYEWMFQSAFSEREFLRERDVIIKEIEKNKAHIQRKFYHLAQENFYKTHPLKYPVIGYLEEFKAVKKEELYAYYKSHYSPNNMILVVGGRFNESEILDSINGTFGKEEERPAPIPLIYPEPTPFSTRTVLAEDASAVTYLSLRFSTIDLNNPDLYALDLTETLLSNGEESPLYKTLVEKTKLAYSISCSSYTPIQSTGYFDITAEIDYKNKDAVIQEITAILSDFKKGKISQDQLNRAKKQKLAEEILSIQTIEDKTSRMGQSMLYGYNTTFYDHYISQFKAVTKDDVKTAVQTYLDPTKMVITILKPKETAETKSPTTNIPKQQSPDLITLNNGIRVLFLNDPQSLKTYAQVMVLGGTRAEKKSNNGIGALLSDMIGKETPKLSKATIRSRIEDQGASMSGQLGKNTFYYQLSCLSEDFNALFPLFTETFTEASFSTEELQESRRRLLKQIDQREDDWQSQANYYFNRAFFQKHPYSLSAIGEKESVKKLNANDISDFYRNLITPKEMIITVVGNFDRKKTLEEIKKRFEPIAAAESKLPALIPAPKHTETNRVSIKPKQDIAALLIGFQGLRFKDTEESIKLDLVDAVLSGMSYPGGRLHNLLREKGLVYMVHAHNRNGIDAGYFLITALTSKDKLKEVETLINGQIEDIQNNPITQKEFDLAIAQMKYYYLDRLSSDENLAVIASTDLLYGNSHDLYTKIESMINTLTLKDVQETAKKYLKTPQIVVIEKK